MWFKYFSLIFFKICYILWQKTHYLVFFHRAFPIQLNCIKPFFFSKNLIIPQLIVPRSRPIRNKCRHMTRIRRSPSLQQIWPVIPLIEIAHATVLIDFFSPNYLIISLLSATYSSYNFIIKLFIIFYWNYGYFSSIYLSYLRRFPLPTLLCVFKIA